MSIKITEEALNLEEVIQEVVSPEFGAIVTFLGCVRDREEGKPIHSIHYEAYQTMAESQLQRIVQSAFERWGAKVAIVHRVGEIPGGEASVIVVSAAPHRREAFAACEFAINEIKADVPIWKTKFTGVRQCA